MGVVEGEILLDWRNRGWIDLFQFASRRRWRGFFDRLIWFVIMKLLLALSVTKFDDSTFNRPEKLTPIWMTQRTRKKLRIKRRKACSCAQAWWQVLPLVEFASDSSGAWKCQSSSWSKSFKYLSAPILLITLQRLHVHHSHHNHHWEQRSLEGWRQSLLITFRLLYLPHNLRTYLQIPA